MASVGITQSNVLAGGGERTGATTERATHSRMGGTRRGLRDRLGAVLMHALADSREPFRTEERELAGYGYRWDEAHLDRLLALELAAHRQRGSATVAEHP